MKNCLSTFFPKTALPAAVLLAVFSTLARAQRNEVVASGGQQVLVGDVHFAATVGELAITTLTDGNLILTQGFHQSQASGCLLFPTAFATELACFGDEDGEAWVEVQGGAPPFSYLWSTGQTSDHITGLSAGQYQVTVADAGGCTQVASTWVIAPPQLIVEADTVIAATTGQNDGAIQLTVSGGTPPFQFLWLGPGGITFDTEDLSGLAPGTYQLEVTDQHGCTAGGSFEVELSNAVHQPAWARSIRISPNPAFGLLLIEAAGLPVRRLEVKAFDANGRPLPLAAGPPLIDASGWPPGPVFLVIRYGASSAVFRVVVQR